jgi:hypothetical protein
VALLTESNLRALDSEYRKRPRQFQRANSYSPRETLKPLTDDDGAMERLVRMDILNTDMVRMWEYLEDLEDLMKGKEDIKCLEQM